MAATIQPASTNRRHASTAEVNVTPFIDVMLVLLIVFMVAAPLATVSLPLQLSNQQPSPPLAVEPIFVSLQDTGIINVGTESAGETSTDWRNLAAVLHAKTDGDKRRQLLIRADQRVRYADVMRLMDELNRQGYVNRTLVTEDVVD